MSSKYRTYDCTTNIILSAKTSSYKPYKSVKDKNLPESKKVEPMHIKIFDRPKKNQRILSRNDRMDLFLEGGNFSQTRQVSTKSQIDRNIYKMSRARRKEEVFLPFRSQTRSNGWQTSNQNCQSQNNKLIKSDYLNFVYTAGECRKKHLAHNEANQQNITEPKKPVQIQIQMPNKVRSEFAQKVCPAREKTQQNPVIGHKNEELRGNYKNCVDKSFVNKQISNSENQLKKINKISRPLFYLDPKEISHIRADSFVVSQYPSGQIIFGNYFKKAGEIASLTKIMTFYTVFQIAQRFSKNVAQELVQIDEEAQSMTGTSAEIFVGDTYTIQQLFYGLMLPSGNDAATALAKWGGSILQLNDPVYKTESKGTEVKTFIRYMNFLAKKCGMKNSKFCNPHGLPHPQSCSNPEDLSCLMIECLSIQLFKEVIRTKRYTCWVSHKGVKHEVIWQNTNKLLRRPNFIGGKTGVTVTAGPCLISCYECLDKILIIVVLRTNKLSRRFKQTRYIVGLALTKLDKSMYRERIKQVLLNDAQLDSDNSEQQLQFNYERNDAKQMAKRNKILTFEM